MMATNAANASVIDLATHPVWRSSLRRSRELAEAMRRHPSSYRDEPVEPPVTRVPAMACAQTRLSLVREAAED